MRKSLGVLLATAVLSLASACGGSGPDQRPAADRASAGSSDAAAVADRPAADAPLSRENFVERLGDAQLEAGSTHLEMSTAAAGTDVAMTGDVRLGEKVEDSASRISMDLGMMQLDLRLVDGVMYLKMGEMSGGKYVKVDLTDPDNPLAQQYGSLTGQIDPSEQLETFRTALVDFDNLGDGGTVDGVETTKLRLVLDTSKALGKQAAQAERLGTKVPEKMEYVLLVGRDDDLLRRMTMDLAGTATTIDWSRWGEPVEVEAPRKSEITDLDSLGPKLGAGGALRG